MGTNSNMKLSYSGEHKESVSGEHKESVQGKHKEIVQGNTKRAFTKWSKQPRAFPVMAIGQTDLFYHAKRHEKKKKSYSDLESFFFQKYRSCIQKKKSRNYVAFQRSSSVSDLPLRKKVSRNKFFLRLIYDQRC